MFLGSRRLNISCKKPKAKKKETKVRLTGQAGKAQKQLGTRQAQIEAQMRAVGLK